MDNERDGIYIPPNYESQVNFLSFSFKRSNFIESLVMLVIPIVLLIKLQDVFGGFLKIPGPILTSCFILAAGIMLFGLSGVNGTTLIGFFGEVFNFLRKRRVAYYNPRVKTEAKPSNKENQDYNELLPKEKLQLLYQNYKNDRDHKHQQQVMELNKELEENSQNLFFQDDIGVIDTPVEYMTSSERKKYKKEQKKKAKEERNRAKRHGKKRKH